MSITPLQLDLTAYALLPRMAGWGWPQEEALPVNGVSTTGLLPQLDAAGVWETAVAV